MALPLALLAAVIVWGGSPPGLARIIQPAPHSAAYRGQAVYFGKCWARQADNCVIDGESLNYQGRHIRLADIEAPDLAAPRCKAEFERGMEAEARLRQLLNQGAFHLEPVQGDLFVLTRQGASLGKMLEREGLAHGQSQAKRSWC